MWTGNHRPIDHKPFSPARSLATETALLTSEYRQQPPCSIFRQCQKPYARDENDIRSFDSTIGSVNAGSDIQVSTTPTARCCSTWFSPLIQKGDWDEYSAGQDCRPAFHHKGSTAVDGLLHRTHIATEHRRNFPGHSVLLTSNSTFALFAWRRRFPSLSRYC